MVIISLTVQVEKILKLESKIFRCFGALGNDELLAMMELMAKNNGAAVDNWILMLQNTIEEERKMVAYLESSTLTILLSGIQMVKLMNYLPRSLDC